MKTLFTLLLNLFCVASFGQTGQRITLYETFEDYQNGKGRYFGKFSDFFYSSSAFKLRTKSKGKVKSTDNLKKHWGFALDSNMIFRMDGVHPSLIIYVDDYMVFYENGALILNGLIPNPKVMEGSVSFVSTSLTTEIVGLPGAFFSMSRPKKKFKDVPEVKVFLECVQKGSNFTREATRKCLSEHAERVSDMD